MKIVIRPVMDPQREIDLTHRLVAAIAQELWRLFGGNEQLNWLEAERHLERIVRGARREAAETIFLSFSPALADTPPQDAGPAPEVGTPRAGPSRRDSRTRHGRMGGANMSIRALTPAGGRPARGMKKTAVAAGA